jgi:hypothetical protein
MKIALFNLIDWKFLDQRPQVFARNLANWGHEVFYFEPFTHYEQWNDTHDHPYEKYQALSWNFRKIDTNLTLVNPFYICATKMFSKIYHKNFELDLINKKKIKEMNFDLAIVNCPRWGYILDELKIPFIYDHVDDTHHMKHVLTLEFYNAQVFCESNSIKNIYIQPHYAKRKNGLYIPNGVNFKDLVINNSAPKIFDGGCLSTLADWFDSNSIYQSKKKILLIGPMENDNFLEYQKYREVGGRNVQWVPRVSRMMGTNWLNQCDVGIIPFDELHGIVDYVMPLKLIEYFYLGLPAVCYVNKGLEILFGDHVQFYSYYNWLGYPNLDEAIDQAKSDNRVEERRKFSLDYSWDKIMMPLKNYLDNYQQKSFQGVSL